MNRRARRRSDDGRKTLAAVADRGYATIMNQPQNATTGAEARAVTGQRFARNLDWNLLRVFHEIHRAGSISHAARVTGRKQPAVSMALRRLEALVGARLCTRGPGGFCLTREGELLAEICEAMFGAVTRIPGMVDATDEVRGRIRLQMISNLVDDKIDRAIQLFHRDYPSVEMFVSIATWDVVPRNVLRNEVEVGITPAHIRDSKLDYHLLFRETYRPYCGRPHSLFGKVFDDPGELAGFGFIHTGADEPDQLTKYRLRHGMGRRVAAFSEHLEEARRLAVLGVGICFLPEAVAAADLASGLLHPVLEARELPSCGIYLLSSPDAPPHRARDIFIGYLRGKPDQG